jgi:O-antigen ligase
MLLVAAAALLYQAITQRESLAWPGIPRPFAFAALAWIVLAVASVAWSEDAPYTLDELRRELLYGALAFTVFHAGTRDTTDVHRAIKALVIGALVLGALEWVRQFFPWLPRAVKYQAAQGSFSTQIVLVAPLLALVAWPRPVGMGARPRTVAAVAVGLLAAGLATENRMLWLAIAAGAVVAFAVFQAGLAPDPARARMLRVLLGALAVIALLVGASWEYKAARYYPRAGGTVESLSYDERPRVWRLGAALVADHPGLGYGFGREILGDRIEAGLSGHGPGPRIRHGHNIFLDVTLQLGLAGLALFVAMLAFLLQAFARVRHTTWGAPIAITGISMIAAFVTKNLSDDFFYRPSSLVFWAITGSLLGLGERLRTA